MTDLLGLLAGIHQAVNQLGGIRIALTELDDMDWCVDRRTGTIHIQPGLDFPTGLTAMMDALAVLAPAATVAPPIAVGETSPGGPATGPRRLTAVPDAPPGR
jgi:hypothetical protein